MNAQERLGQRRAGGVDGRGRRRDLRGAVLVVNLPATAAILLEARVGRVTGLLAVFTLVAMMAKAGPTSQCRAEAPAVRAVRAVAEGIVAADNRRDLERVLAYYTDDAVLMPPGEGPVVGRAKIRPRYEALFEAFDPEIQLEVHEACVDGGLGFVRGRNGGRLRPRAPGEVRLLDDGFLMLLRASQGAWRISHLIWHRQGPAPPPD